MTVLTTTVALLAGALAGTATRPLLFTRTVPAGAPLRHACPSCDAPAPTAIRLLAPPRGRCASCRTPWYPSRGLPEAMTALAFALVAATGLTGWLAAAHYWVAACGTALILIDAKVHRLPNILTAPAFAGTITLLAAAAAAGEPGSFARCLAAAAALGSAFALMTFGGIGLGDVKLAPTLGALLGWHNWATVLVGTFAMFALGATVNLLQRRTRGRIAFGPYMIIGALGVSVCVS
ncbi:prepilin peptidase [Streptomyces sp. ID05-04B]|uniref:prepilin peptidase n=1 Tax=Streptomyces sp. ID05-04B TaxID=3028661 RepID=UPI0029C25790|nr:prepilin peptidase [Streptomyces sp. ID05-04B]MDX5566275.1 prepilin peptidase [Streptomyces sp. ID05-04B]